MTDPIPRTPPARRRGSLGQSLLTVAAAAITSASLIWSALFYNATNKHAAAVAATPAAAAQAGPTRGAAQPATAPAPVTTRTS